jgi:hypothetical protein
MLTLWFSALAACHDVEEDPHLYYYSPRSHGESKFALEVCTMLGDETLIILALTLRAHLQKVPSACADCCQYKWHC